MGNKIQCSTHGERQQAFVCSHLVGEAAGLGFNRNEPDEENPFPDAWCDDCEIIRAAHHGWNQESEKLTKIVLLCSGCYERARIRNTHTSTSLDDLAGLRWKCSSCDDWHTGPCLDFGYDSPHYWLKKHQKENDSRSRRSEKCKTFLDENYCAIEDRDFFVRGIIELPIIGTAENLAWGVWGSLSRENFAVLLRADKDAKRAELAPMFSWLSTRIHEYPDTLILKMYAHIQKPGLRPKFELEPTDHPLALEYHKGITPERVKEIMLGRLRQTKE